MKCAIIGYGSIGARHARLLREKGIEPVIISRRAEDHALRDVGPALKEQRPDCIFLCNETALHGATLEALEEAVEGAKVLIEKPVLSSLKNVPQLAKNLYFVGYNLRFHPIISWIKEVVQQEPVVSFVAQVGSYLPDWRPGTDYRVTYSAQNKLGGGVLLDLSHEIDLARYLCGPLRFQAGTCGRISLLEIDAEDCADLLLSSSLGARINLHLDYISRFPVRRGLLHTQRRTIEYDLISGTLQDSSDGKRTVLIDRDKTYQDQISAFLEGDTTVLCTLEEGLDTVAIVDESKGCHQCQ